MTSPSCVQVPDASLKILGRKVGHSRKWCACPLRVRAPHSHRAQSAAHRNSPHVIFTPGPAAAAARSQVPFHSSRCCRICGERRARARNGESRGGGRGSAASSSRLLPPAPRTAPAAPRVRIHAPARLCGKGVVLQLRQLRVRPLQRRVQLLGELLEVGCELGLVLGEIGRDCKGRGAERGAKTCPATDADGAVCEWNDKAL